MAERPDGLACIRQSSSKVPPTLTEGTITPEILHRWERACLDHFHHKKIPDNFGHFLPLVLDGSLLRTRDKRTWLVELLERGASFLLPAVSSHD